MVQQFLYAAAFMAFGLSPMVFAKSQGSSVLANCSVFNQDGISLAEGASAESSTNTEQDNSVSGNSEIYEYSGFKKVVSKNIFEFRLVDRRSGKSARAESELRAGRSLILHLDNLAEPYTTLSLKCVGYAS